MSNLYFLLPLLQFYSLFVHVRCDNFIGGMRLGSFEEERNFFESHSKLSHEASIASETCSASCDQGCDSSCDLFWIFFCDESCDSACDADDVSSCGDVQGQIKWYDDVEEYGDDLEQDIKSSEDEAKIAYDCYDELYLFQESEFSQEYLAKHGTLHPHIVRKQEIISKLAEHGLNYGDYRKARLQDVSEESLQRYLNVNRNELELLLTESYSSDTVNPKFNIHPNSGWGCSSAYIGLYDGLGPGFHELDDSLSSDYDTALTLGVGWEVSILVFSFGEEIGIAMSNKAIGVYISQFQGLKLIELGISAFGVIGFVWDYETIEGNSYDIGVEIGIDIFGLSLSFGFASDTEEWEDLVFGFGFGVAIPDIIPFTFSFPSVDTDLLDITDLVKWDTSNEIHYPRTGTDDGSTTDDKPPETITITIEDGDGDDDDDSEASSSYFGSKFWQSWSSNSHSKSLFTDIGTDEAVFLIAGLSIFAILILVCCVKYMGKCRSNKWCFCQVALWNVKNSEYELLDDESEFLVCT